MKLLITVLLVSLVLAGCAGPEPAAKHADEVAAAPSSQEPSGRGGLDVYVLDPALRPLEGALVTLANNLTGMSNGDGHVAFDDLPAGVMLITASLDGYRTATSGATVEAGTRVQANVKLLAGEAGTAGPAGNESYTQQFHLRGYFE